MVVDACEAVAHLLKCNITRSAVISTPLTLHYLFSKLSAVQTVNYKLRALLVMCLGTFFQHLREKKKMQLLHSKQIGFLLVNGAWSKDNRCMYTLRSHAKAESVVSVQARSLQNINMTFDYGIKYYASCYCIGHTYSFQLRQF